MKKFKGSPWIIFLSIFLGIIAGVFSGSDKGLFGISYYSIYDLVGTLFINSLTLIIIPLVSASIITGVINIGKEHSFGRLGLKTFGFYLGMNLVAILVGLLFVNLIHPGTFAEIQTGDVAIGGSAAYVANADKVNLSQLLIKIIPSNIFMALSHGEMLGLIFFSILFGFAISKIESELSQTLYRFWKGIYEAMIVMTQLVMKCLPIGVFCLVAKIFASTGIESLKPLLLFVLTAIVSLLTFGLIILPLVLKLKAKVSPIAHIKAMGPTLMTAFSTSSSSATLPMTMESVEKRVGISSRISSFVIPLGGSLNLSGSSLYVCIASLFIAQIYGLELSLANQLIIVFLSLLTTMGVAGIPSGCLVCIIVVLKVMKLPAEGIVLIVALDRLIDMVRTTVNVFSNSCSAVLVASSEGEKILKPGLQESA